MNRLGFLTAMALTVLGGCSAASESESPQGIREADRAQAGVSGERSETEGAALPFALGAGGVLGTGGAPITELTREHVAGDVYHYAFVLSVGETPNAKLRIHRVAREIRPWQPRPARDAVLLLHGDFATFVTNFAPSLGSPPSPGTGLSVYLAERGIDVWGVDRRWARVPATSTDTSDFGDMGVAQEIDDIGRALGIARVVRAATGGGAGQLILSGFSHGGQLAYAYASTEAKRPARERHVKGLVPLDVYAAIAPEDEALRKAACNSRDFERQALADGIVDADNGFVLDLGGRALAAPNAPSPYFEALQLTNREALLHMVGQTYRLFEPLPPLYAPRYHLASGVIERGKVIGLRESSEDVVARWFAGGAFHQSMREGAELDALWCNEGPLPVDVPLERIRVPLFYIGTAGGFGDHGLYSTTRVGSTDVTTLVLRRFPVEREAEDFGHGDILYGREAPQRAWRPLAAWIRAHGG
ncbi:hypothetical protein [Pendulispora albinea]|uniref:Alpha/beta hydrolase n=1 Tax=Pendulispora albinea TaxID=2741071 RepID=A0ABZ2M7S6_9BACT